MATWLIAEPIAETSPLNALIIAGNVPKIEVKALPNAVMAGAALPIAVPTASTSGESLASPGAASPTALMTVANAVPKALMIVPAALPIPWTTVLNAEPIEPMICETPLAWLASSENEATINAIPAPIPTAAIAAEVPKPANVEKLKPFKPCKTALSPWPKPLKAVDSPVPMPFAAVEMLVPADLMILAIPLNN